jgi:hypothetical protein
MDVLKKKLTATEKQSEQMEQYRQQLEKLQVKQAEKRARWVSHLLSMRNIWYKACLPYHVQAVSDTCLA